MVEIERTIFRRYDIRGKYPKELNEEAAYNIGLSYSSLYKNIKRIVVGSDARKSSPSLKESVIRGLIDGGKEVTDIGTVITPVLCFSICHYGFEGGIQITPSHMGGEYNGIKLFLADAYQILPPEMEQIMQLIIDDKMVKAKEVTKRVKKISPEDDYVKYIQSKIKLKKHLRIIIDTGNGTAGMLPEKVYKSFGCIVRTMYPEPDESFPHHNPDPYIEENTEDLKKMVISQGADLGVAYDADGDRTGIVMANGEYISGDDMLMLFTRDAMKKRKGPTAYDSRASMALIEDVKKEGQKVYLTVGYHSAVLGKIKEVNAIFGGETTGHYYFPMEYYLYDDGIFASLKIAQIAAEVGDFSKYVKGLPKYFASKEIFIDFPDTKKYEAVENFTRMVKAKGYDINDIDGARINLDNGWGIVRASNTSPFIKVKFEGKTPANLKEVAKKVISLMDNSGIIMPEEHRKKLGL